MSSFEQLKTMCDSKLAALEAIDYDVKRKEVMGMSQSRTVISSPHDLSDEMAAIQGSKDRMFEIVQAAQRNQAMSKKVAEILVDAATKNSEEKSQDKRKGDASSRVASYLLAATEADSFMRFCMGALKNLDSRHDTVSRRITCMQMTINLQDSGREGVIRDTAPKDTKALFDSEQEEIGSSAPTTLDKDSTGFTEW
jgi:hypothetical protein